MTTFVHIADARNAKAIQRSGLLLSRLLHGFVESDIRKAGVFALPLVENFVISHQWVRELKRRGFRQAVGVYFRVPDAEIVWAGAYNQPKQSVTAATAAAMLRESGAMGFEVVIPRSITAAEVRYVRALPQVLGWRYFPEAKGRPPFCGCAYCQRGLIRSRGLRERYEQGTTKWARP
jgi:hypothetical protein